MKRTLLFGLLFMLAATPSAWGFGVKAGGPEDPEPEPRMDWSAARESA